MALNSAKRIIAERCIRLEKVVEFRFHGRGGQGAVSSAEILASAAFNEGREAQAFPFFGVARRGAPTQAFTRISEKKIRLHQNVYEPDCIVILDDTLVNEKIFGGLKKKGTVVIASKKKASEFRSVAPKGSKLFVADAYSIAREEIGKPIVSTAILGAVVKATKIVSMESLEKAIQKAFPGPIGEKNASAARKCFENTK